MIPNEFVISGTIPFESTRVQRVNTTTEMQFIYLILLTYIP